MDDRIEVSKKSRKNLPLCICGELVDQIALYVADIDLALIAYERTGIKIWFRDFVRAKDTITGVNFGVKLAFNYEILPVEFELIQIVEGKTVQIPDGGLGGLSHYGFHVYDMDKSVDKFESYGYRLMSSVLTLSHTGTVKRYRYVFFDTRKDYGFITKLIVEV